MRRAPGVLLVALALAACGPSVVGAPTGVAPSPRSELTVFAAASLRNAVEAAGRAYAQATGTAITVSTDSSAALRTQIEQGAPADVFLSADTAQPAALADAGLAAGEPRVFASNRLAIITPLDGDTVIASPADLAKDGLRIVAAGDEVPITRYATEMVGNLARLDGYPADFAAAYERNVVSREDNVAAVVAKIELGEGDAAIVYVTDASASDGVEVVAVPDAANVQASYAGVEVASSANVEAASGFLAWLTGPDGQHVLAGFGFLPPGP
jgi:molybdate transport system substrate-binding protein